MSSESLLIIPVVLAILPSLLTLALLCKVDFRKWVLAILGGGGWFIALIARLGLLAFISKTVKEYLIAELSSSILAGLFEETARYFLIKHVFRKNEVWSSKHLTSFGLGWGLIEAILIYVSQALYLGYVLQVEWFNLIPGAIERNIAVLFHVALTFLIAYIIRKGKFILILVPITLHAVSNIYAVLVFNFVKNPWLTELLILLLLVPISVAIILATMPRKFAVS